MKQLLTPAIIQNAQTNEVLMLGYMSSESLTRTKKTGWVWFWSRSRKKLWKKGETSGNMLKVKEIVLDCDRDTFLIKVDPLGPTCHTGTVSCFTKKENTI